MSGAQNLCYATCKFFRCGQRTLYFRGRGAWCRFADDECDLKTCKFAQCIRERLLPNGVCGLTVKVKQIEVEPDESVKPIRVPSKLARKVGEKELF